MKQLKKTRSLLFVLIAFTNYTVNAEVYSNVRP